MTENKPIIINGVDVSKCNNFDNGECINPAETVSACESAPFCLFKQLTRKTQECEELKFKVQDLRRLRELDKEARERFVQQLDQLKAEKELYKTWYRAKHGDVKDYLDNLNAEKKQDEQKLERIREICKPYTDLPIDEFVKILQIIDE